MADDAFARLVRNAGSVSGEGVSPPPFSGSVNGREPYPLDKWNPTNLDMLILPSIETGAGFTKGQR